jgi:hypothetical protein
MNLILKVSLLLAFVFFLSYSKAQELTILTAKKAYDGNNQLLQSYTSISINNIITVKKGGMVNFQSLDKSWQFTLTKGTYKLDSAYSANKKMFLLRMPRDIQYIDSLLPKCGKFTNYFVCGTGGYDKDMSYRAGNIDFLNRDAKQRNIVLYTGDSALVSWRDPKAFKGTYYVVVSNLYDEVIGHKTTQDTFVYLNFALPEKMMIVKIFTDDCRMSSEIGVKKE